MTRISRRQFLKQTGVITALGVFAPGQFLRPWLGQPGREGQWFEDALDLTAQPEATQPGLLAPAAYQLQTPHQALIMDLDGATYQNRFDQLVNQGYRSIWTQGVGNGSGAATFSGIFVRNTSSAGWYQYLNLTADQYQAYFNDFANQGYKPISVSGYQDFGATRFGAIWVAAPGAGYSGIHNANSDQYQAYVNAQIAANLRPEVVDGYAIGSTDYYISIWDNANNLPWIARHRMTSADYQKNFNDFGQLGFRVYALSAYKVGSTTLFAAFWVKDGLNDWFGRHDWLAGDLFNAAVNDTKNDYQPIVIESYDTGSTRHFGGVWIKKPRSWTTTGAYNASLASFDAVVKQFMQERDIPSGSLAVTRNSKLVYARGYRWDYDGIDPVQPDALFRIASVSKPLTSLGIMLLVQQGKLKLSDRLVNLVTLPAPADTRMNNITVLHLLQHLGGWNRDTTFDPMFYDTQIAAALNVALPISKQNIMTYMTGRMLDFTPGSMMNYSNYGYLLLGRIIEAVSGLSYGNFMLSKVFTPLGMKKTRLGSSLMELRKPGEISYYVTNPGLFKNLRAAGAPVNVMAPYGGFNLENMDAHGGYIASAVDLARFSTVFDDRGFPFLTMANIDQTFAVPAIGTNPDGSWYACGWAVRPAGGGLNTWHNGSLPGTSTLLVRRSDGLNWVALFNRRDDPSGKSYGDIDWMLHNAANAVSSWPRGDLFPSYGIPAITHRKIYAPAISK